MTAPHHAATDNQFVRAARKAAIAWKATTPTLPNDARHPGAYRRWAALPFCLPKEFAEYNLLPEARIAGLSRFELAGIPWHDGHEGPSNHLLSSQVQCVNALAPFVGRPDALAALFGSVLPIAEVLPFGAMNSGGASLSQFDATDHVVFEWQGIANYLHEWVGTPVRGAKATSADAAIRYRTPSGTIEVALIEWKYTEKYPSGKISASATSHDTRVARYQPLLDDPDCPIDTSALTLDDLLVEPVYQLMRQALLAHRMEATRELDAEIVRVVYVAPAANHELWASPGSPGFAALAAEHDGHAAKAWRSLLREPSRFVVLDSATLLAAESPISAEFKARYGHLAEAIEAHEAGAQTRFNIRRDVIGFNDPQPADTNDGLADYHRFGEQIEWGYAIPGMYQMLASPARAGKMPRPPQAGESPFSGSGYWAPLLHLMLFSLGWAHPARGLRWWYEQGQPALDTHLSLVRDLWATDGQLDWFAAWLWDGPLTSPGQLPMPGRPPQADATARRLPTPLPVAWFEQQRQTASSSRIPAPYGGGGYDLLHLSAHCAGPLQRPLALARAHRHGRHTVVTIPSMFGWYRALHGVDVDTSKVKVVIESVGPVGTFHRSPVTDRWHATTETIHLAGS